MSVYCPSGVQQYLQEAHGVLYHFALAYDSSPSTWSHKYRGTFLSQKVLFRCYRILGSALSTYQQEERKAVSLSIGKEHICLWGFFLSVCLLYLHSFGVFPLQYYFINFFLIFFKKLFAGRRCPCRGVRKTEEHSNIRADREYTAPCCALCQECRLR